MAMVEVDMSYWDFSKREKREIRQEAIKDLQPNEIKEFVDVYIQDSLTKDEAYEMFLDYLKRYFDIRIESLAAEMEFTEYLKKYKK